MTASTIQSTTLSSQCTPFLQVCYHYRLGYLSEQSQRASSALKHYRMGIECAEESIVRSDRLEKENGEGDAQIGLLIEWCCVKQLLLSLSGENGGEEGVRAAREYVSRTVKLEQNLRNASAKRETETNDNKAENERQSEKNSIDSADPHHFQASANSKGHLLTRDSSNRRGISVRLYLAFAETLELLSGREGRRGVLAPSYYYEEALRDAVRIRRRMALCTYTHFIHSFIFI